MRYVSFVEDERGDAVDMLIFCGPLCFAEYMDESAYGHGWPCPEKADYRQYCPSCGTVVVAATDEPSFDGWPVKV